MTRLEIAEERDAVVKERDALREMSEKLAGVLKQAIDFIEHPPAMSTGDRMWHQDRFIKETRQTLLEYEKWKGERDGAKS